MWTPPPLIPESSETQPNTTQPETSFMEISTDDGHPTINLVEASPSPNLDHKIQDLMLQRNRLHAKLQFFEERQDLYEDGHPEVVETQRALEKVNKQLLPKTDAHAHSALLDMKTASDVQWLKADEAFKK